MTIVIQDVNITTGNDLIDYSTHYAKKVQ